MVQNLEQKQKTDANWLQNFSELADISTQKIAEQRTVIVNIVAADSGGLFTVDDLKGLTPSILMMYHANSKLMAETRFTELTIYNPNFNPLTLDDTQTTIILNNVCVSANLNAIKNVILTTVTAKDSEKTEILAKLQNKIVSNQNRVSYLKCYSDYYQDFVNRLNLAKQLAENNVLSSSAADMVNRFDAVRERRGLKKLTVNGFAGADCTGSFNQETNTWGNSV